MYRFTEWAIWWRFGWPLTIVAGVAVWFVYSRFLAGHWQWTWGNIVGALALFVLAPYLFFILPYFSLRKHFRRNPHVAGPITYVFSEMGIDVSAPYVFSEAGIEVSAPGSQTHLDWEMISRVSETSSWFLVYPRTFPQQNIPKRFLGDADQQAKLRTLVRTYAKSAKLQLLG